MNAKTSYFDDVSLRSLVRSKLLYPADQSGVSVRVDVQPSNQADALMCSHPTRPIVFVRRHVKCHPEEAVHIYSIIMYSFGSTVYVERLTFMTS